VKRSLAGFTIEGGGEKGSANRPPAGRTTSSGRLRDWVECKSPRLWLSREFPVSGSSERGIQFLHEILRQKVLHQEYACDDCQRQSFQVADQRSDPQDDIQALVGIWCKGLATRNQSHRPRTARSIESHDSYREWDVS